MNRTYEFESETASPGVYQRCVWALVTAGIVIVLFFQSWHSILRLEIDAAARRQHDAEKQTAAAQRDRDAAWRDRAETVKALNERLAKAEAARLDAEKEARELAANAINASASSGQAGTAKEKPATPWTESSGPTAQGLTTFIKAHLGHLAEAVDAQLADYAEEVDFHDKPHATQTTIRNDREQLAQKFPIRLILKDEIQPQITVVRDVRFGWVATATFDWRWVYKSRSGALARGLTRDTWKIIPTAQGFKIISEHSADPTTGQPKD